jgi:hypothetical protein
VSEAQRALAGKRELDDDELATVVAKPLSADEAAALVSKPRGGKSRSIVQGAPLVLDDTTVADSRPRFSEDEPDDPTQVYRPAKKAKGASAKGPGGESPLARLAAVAVPQLTVPHARGGPGRAGPQQRAKAPPPPEPPEPDPVQVFRTPAPDPREPPAHLGASSPGEAQGPAQHLLASGSPADEGRGSFWVSVALLAACAVLGAILTYVIAGGHKPAPAPTAPTSAPKR